MRTFQQFIEASTPRPKVGDPNTIEYRDEHGRLHNIDGPAVHSTDSRNPRAEYYIKGRKLSQANWLREKRSIKENNYFDSPEFGRGVAHHLSGNDIEIDGRIEIDWSNTDHDNNFSLHKHSKSRLVSYKIFNIDDKLVKSGSFDWGLLPDFNASYYIIYELARREGIYKPSNYVTDNGKVSTAGVSQPQIDMAEIKRFWPVINKILNSQ